MACGNEREACAGQTRSVLTRMEQHGADREMAAFGHASVVYCDELNMSVLTDCEHRLVQPMGAEGVYRFASRSVGLKEPSCFSKDECSRKFEGLWDDLRGERLPGGRRPAETSVSALLTARMRHGVSPTPWW